MEERSVNNVCDQPNLDNDYQEVLQAECDIYQQYESLNLPKEQDKIVEAWGEAITAKNAAYSSVVFRMGMQCCFSLLLQLADLKKPTAKSNAIFSKTEGSIRLTVYFILYIIWEI